MWNGIVFGIALVGLYDCQSIRNQIYIEIVLLVEESTKYFDSQCLRWLNVFITLEYSQTSLVENLLKGIELLNQFALLSFRQLLDLGWICFNTITLL
jgi:hypothetical protein